MLEQCCNHSKGCRKNAATPCCATNRSWEKSCVISPLEARKGAHGLTSECLKHAHKHNTWAVAAMNSCFALIRDQQCITNKAVYHQPWVGVCAVTYSLIRTNVFKTMPSWLWAWSSSIALGTWRSKTFPDLKHDVLVLFYYIIIIDVEMNGVLLGIIFSASLILLKNIRCIL